MSYLTQHDLVLTGLGFFVGVFAIVFGGSMFLSVPLFQYLFPEASIGQVVGNLKVGSVLRNVGSTLTTFRNINWAVCLNFAWPFVIGAILGVFVIKDLSQVWLLPMVVIAIVIAETADKLQRLKVPREFYYLVAFGSGIYAGVLGIGIALLIVALMRVDFPEDKKIAWVKMQARFIELLIAIVALATHLYNQNIVFEMWFFWAIGSILGGLAGGGILSWMQREVSAAVQKAVLRTSYVFALVIALMSVCGWITFRGVGSG